MITDSPVLDRMPVEDTEKTIQMWALERWQWPTTDPDEAVLDEAHAALHCPDEPTLPILEAVLAGLYRLAT